MDWDHTLLYLKDLLIRLREALVLTGRQFLTAPSGQDAHFSIVEYQYQVPVYENGVPVLRTSISDSRSHLCHEYKRILAETRYC